MLLCIRNMSENIVGGPDNSGKIGKDRVFDAYGGTGIWRQSTQIPVSSNLISHVGVKAFHPCAHLWLGGTSAVIFLIMRHQTTKRVVCGVFFFGGGGKNTENTNKRPSLRPLLDGIPEIWSPLRECKDQNFHIFFKSLRYLHTVWILHCERKSPLWCQRVRESSKIQTPLKIKNCPITQWWFSEQMNIKKCWYTNGCKGQRCNVCLVGIFRALAMFGILISGTVSGAK